MGQDMTKGANVAAAKYYVLRALPENVKQLYSILTNIWRFQAIYVIRFDM